MATGQQEEPQVAKAMDPVCRLRVDRETAAARSERDGLTYYFHSLACKVEFDTHPARYAAGRSPRGRTAVPQARRTSAALVLVVAAAAAAVTAAGTWLTLFAAGGGRGQRFSPGPGHHGRTGAGVRAVTLAEAELMERYERYAG